jgi:hypothetical protein
MTCHMPAETPCVANAFQYYVVTGLNEIKSPTQGPLAGVVRWFLSKRLDLKKGSSDRVGRVLVTGFTNPCNTHHQNVRERALENAARAYATAEAVAAWHRRRINM